MSISNDPNGLNNDPHDPWSHEQAPFVAAEAGTPSVVEDVPAGAASATGYAAGSERASGNPEAAGAYATGAAGVPPAGSWGPVGAGYVPPAGYAPHPPAAVGSSEPNPAAAFLLGLIPGVGAMYNGQVPKGFVHLIVFAVLVTLSNNVNGIFGIFVAGWIFFQAFEAYHTAKARRDGLPLPNAFGWNDIGERVGLGRNWPFSPAPATAQNVSAAGAVPSAEYSGNPGGWTTPPPSGPSAATPFSPADPAAYANVAPNWANWAGYVPPTAFASAPPAGTVGVGGGSGSVPPGHGMPYAPVSAGAYPPLVPGPDLPPASRLPVGAIWLIGLGVLFLMGQWTPLLHFGRVWIPSLVLAALAAFLFVRRMGWTGSPAWQQRTGMPMGLRVATAIRMPGALLTIAILNGLHEAWVVRWYRSWPCLLIVVGVLMLVERMALRQAAGPDINPDAPTGGL